MSGRMEALSRFALHPEGWGYALAPGLQPKPGPASVSLGCEDTRRGYSLSGTYHQLVSFPFLPGTESLSSSPGPTRQWGVGSAIGELGG